VSIRAEWAEVSCAQIVVADQLEVVIVRLVRTYGAVAGWLAAGLAWPVALPVFWLAGRYVDDVFVSGLRMRVMPCRVLAHDYPPLLAVCGANSDYLPGPTAL
jgi:hypothetical protein